MLTTRLARIDDAYAIAALQRQSWMDRGINHELIPPLDAVAAEWVTAIRDQQESGRIIVVVKDADSTIVGCAGVIRTVEPRLCELILLEVAPHERRNKIGSRLVNACADLARGFGADSMHAWIGLNETAATHLLESAGWQKSGGQREKLEIDTASPRHEVELHTSLIE
jgi:N-acetylglutamate synthase-like GNAT family acetyltransferase